MTLKGLTIFQAGVGFSNAYYCGFTYLGIRYNCYCGVYLCVSNEAINNAVFCFGLIGYVIFSMVHQGSLAHKHA